MTLNGGHVEKLEAKAGGEEKTGPDVKIPCRQEAER